MTPRRFSENSVEKSPETLSSGTAPLHEALSESGTERRRRLSVKDALATTAICVAGGIVFGSISFIREADEEELYKEVGININAGTRFNTANDAMSKIASEIGDKYLRVDCNDAALDSLGVYIEDGVAYRAAGAVYPITYKNDALYAPVLRLREDICNTILSYQPVIPSYGGKDYSDYIERTNVFANALQILLHEIEHTNGISNEAKANCHSYQKVPVVLEDLGVDPFVGSLVSHEIAHENAKITPQSYLTEECRPGGDFDLNISDIYLTPRPTVAITDNNTIPIPFGSK